MTAVAARHLQLTPLRQATRSRKSSNATYRDVHVRCSLDRGPSDVLTRLATACAAAAVALTALPCNAVPVLANKPTFSADYAAVVRKREGKTKSSLPTSREAEALLAINEDLFTTEALEGMSRCPTAAPSTLAALQATAT